MKLEALKHRGIAAYGIDIGTLSVTIASEQSALLDTVEKYESAPSLPQAQRLKKLSQSGKLALPLIDSIPVEEKKEPVKVTLTGSRLKQYFPKDHTPKQMEKVISGTLESWHRKQAVS